MPGEAVNYRNAAIGAKWMAGASIEALAVEYGLKPFTINHVLKLWEYEGLRAGKLVSHRTHALCERCTRATGYSDNDSLPALIEVRCCACGERHRHRLIHTTSSGSFRCEGRHDAPHLVEEWIRDGWLHLSPNGKNVLLPNRTMLLKPEPEVREVIAELQRRMKERTIQ